MRGPISCGISATRALDQHGVGIFKQVGLVFGTAWLCSGSTHAFMSDVLGTLILSPIMLLQYLPNAQINHIISVVGYGEEDGIPYWCARSAADALESWQPGHARAGQSLSVQACIGLCRVDLCALPSGRICQRSAASPCPILRRIVLNSWGAPYSEQGTFRRAVCVMPSISPQQPAPGTCTRGVNVQCLWQTCTELPAVT